MEAALTRSGGEYQRYGSTTHKQVYIYGSLDTRPDRAQAQFRRGLGDRRLAAAGIPGADRSRGGTEAARARRRGARHDLRESLHEGGVAGRGAQRRGDRRLWAALDGREVPRQSEQGDRRLNGAARLARRRVLVDRAGHAVGVDARGIAAASRAARASASSGASAFGTTGSAPCGSSGAITLASATRMRSPSASPMPTSSSKYSTS